MAGKAPTPPAPVPAPAPAAPAAAPAPTTQTMRKETFVDDQGRLYQVDATEAEGARAMGLRPASLDESMQAERNKIADSAVGKTIAFATGGVPLLSTALVKGAEYYGEEPAQVAEAVSHSQEANPGSYYTGMAATALLPGAAARGAGLLGRGGARVGATALAEGGARLAAEGGAAAVEAGAEALGAGAGAAAEAATQTTRIGRGLQAAAKGAARVGAEGAAYGAAAGVDEKALGDPEANGQALAAAGAHSAFWGGIMGAGLGGGLGLVGGLLRRVPAGSLSEAMGDAERVRAMPKGAFAPGSEAAVKETAEYEAKVEASAQKVGVRSEEMRAALHEAETAATTATESTVERTETETGRATGTATTEGKITADGVGDAVLKKIFGKNEEAYEAASAIWKERLNSLAVQEERLDANAGKLVDAGNKALRAENAMQKVAFGEAKATQMAELVDPAKWETAQNATFTTIQDARGVVNKLEGYATKGGSQGSLERVGNALTDVEAKAESLIKATDKKVALRDYFVSLDSLKRQVGKEAQFGKTAIGLTDAAREFDSLYERMRVMMEDQNTWGKAGAAQQEINKATSEALSTYKKFSRDFVHEYGAEAGRPTFEFRSDAAKGHLSNVTEFAERDKSRGLNDWSNGLERRLDAVEKHYALTPAEKAEFREGREALKNLRTTLGDATKDASKVAKIRALQAEERAGAMGGTLGMLTSAFTQPISTVARLGEARIVLNSVSERILSGAKNIVEKGESTATQTTKETSRALTLGRSVTEGEAVNMSASQSYTKRREVASVAIDRIRDLSSNPEAMTSKINGAIQRYTNHAPETSKSMATTLGRGVGYLASKLPPGGPTQPSVQPFQQKPRYSDTEIRDFTDRYAGVTNPLSLLDDMQSGAVSRAKVEAVRAVYPEVFAKIQSSIAMAASASPKPLSWERIKMMAVVFGVPTHPAFDPGFIAAVQAPMQAGTEGGEASGQGPAQPSATSRYSARPLETKPADYQSPTERMAVSP